MVRRQAVPAQERGRVHGPAAGRLHGQQLEHAVLRSVQQPAVARGQRARLQPIAGRGVGRGGGVGGGGGGVGVGVGGSEDGGGVNAEEAAVGEQQARADVRAQRPDDALGACRRRGRVQQTVLGLDLLGVGGAGLVLVLERRRPAPGGEVEHAHDQVPAERGQARRQRAVGVVGLDRLGRGHADGPAVETRRQAHDRDAGLAVAGHDRALDRRGSAPARQQRRVDVEEVVV
jgi:hypothetical protein